MQVCTPTNGTKTLNCRTRKNISILYLRLLHYCSPYTRLGKGQKVIGTILIVLCAETPSDCTVASHAITLKTNSNTHRLQLGKNKVNFIHICMLNLHSQSSNMQVLYNTNPTLDKREDIYVLHSKFEWNKFKRIIIAVNLSTNCTLLRALSSLRDSR